MKDYLKKLGSRKFQALLTSIVVNVVSAVLFFTGTLEIDAKVNEWMPIINMTIGTVSTWVYILVEGASDRASIQSKAVQEIAASDEPRHPLDAH